MKIPLSLFDGGTNILYGDNAQGKTKYPEATISSGISPKSHKGSRERN